MIKNRQFCLGIFFLLASILAIQIKAQTVLFAVENYDAVITPDLENKSVKGEVSVRFISQVENLREIILNAGSLEIDSVTENFQKLQFEKKESLLKIQFPSLIKKGEKRKINITYHGTPKFGIKFFPEQNQVYTIFSTSQWMPCVDAPADRASFRLNLIAPKNVKIVGNGDFVKENVLPNGTISSEWEQKNHVPTYLFGFAFGEFKELTERSGRVALRYLADKSLSDEDLRKIFATTKDMLAFYETKAGVKYPYKTYTQILAKGNAAQEMDSFSALNEDYGRGVLKDEKDVWLGAHEFAHQWWGNMVTNRDWTHFWLNEGITNFMTAAYLEHRFGRKRYLSEIERYKTSYEKVRDSGLDKPLVFPDWNKPTRNDRILVYDKGAYIVHLLREELGEKLFWKGFREYTQKYFGKSVETKDFQIAMEKSSGKDLSKFFGNRVYLKTN